MIPDSSAKIHGITQDIAVETGVHIDLILEEFMEVLNRATVLVAHNIEFDWHVMTAEYYRQLNYVPDKFHHVDTFCTMKAWTPGLFSVLRYNAVERQTTRMESRGPPNVSPANARTLSV